VRSADVDDCVLNADGVRELQRTQLTGRNDDTLARARLYWSMLRDGHAQIGFGRGAVGLVTAPQSIRAAWLRAAAAMSSRGRNRVPS
jgi:hypothetical protein